MGSSRHIARTTTLDIEYEEHGPQNGNVVILLHGFPYSPRGYDAVWPLLTEMKLRVIVPSLRGYGGTRFVDNERLRSGQQGALAQDLLDLMDALDIRRAMLAGYDWGGRAACIVAALWPERVTGLVTGEGYNLQDIPASVAPATPETEHRLWYQYYFHTERGRRGLSEDRNGIARLLWRLWSPTWTFSDQTFMQSAAYFNNPDFVDVVIHSYRHRFACAPGDAAYDGIERELERQPTISVPTIALSGLADGVASVPRDTSSDMKFTGRFVHRSLAQVGHNIPEEAPAEMARAILDLLAD